MWRDITKPETDWKIVASFAIQETNTSELLIYLRVTKNWPLVQLLAQLPVSVARCIIELFYIYHINENKQAMLSMLSGSYP